ncbi:hypothetical protein ACIRUL_15615 [Streptomyces sp. NPDC101171]|uniref:hypothetical protein n=1 Tax=Streptomyces sp. NPDC101171 TaxID=3366122 RepID=UPI003811011E
MARFLPALAAVLAAKPLGAELITGMSRHAERQKLARCCYGATDLVEERGEEGIIKIEELIGGLGADSVVEAVGNAGGRPGRRRHLRWSANRPTRAPVPVHLDTGKILVPLPSEQATEGYKAMDERRGTKVLLTL